MSNTNESIDKTNKMFFLFGLTAGVAAMSLVVFILLFFLVYTNKAGNVLNTANNAGSAGTVVQQPSQVANDTLPEPEVVAVKAIQEGEHVKGNPDAPIEIIEYSDFECPFCSRFYPNIDQAIADFGDDIKIVYRHFPLSFHPNAKPAAMAAECAGDQGKFWEMHDELFEMSAGAGLNQAGYIAAAQELGMDTASFEECLTSGKYSEKVDTDMAEGSSYGVSGTPTTFVNGEIVRGAVSYPELKAVIERNLQK